MQTSERKEKMKNAGEKSQTEQKSKRNAIGGVKAIKHVDLYSIPKVLKGKNRPGNSITAAEQV